MDQLLDNTVDTYWQSDGPQPHLVNIQFRRKTTIHDVCIYTDYKADESYTPNRSVTYYVYLLVLFIQSSHMYFQGVFLIYYVCCVLFCRISLRAGTHFNDLIEVDQIELSEPVGWVCVPMKDINEKPIRTFMVQIAVLSNHQNGRDTHLRRIKIRSPVQDTYVVKTPKFTSLELMQLAYIK